MSPQELQERLVELVSQMGITVRRADLGGAGGSLVRLRGQDVLFLDTSADPEDQLQRLAPDVARLPNLDDIYIIPELRELLEEYS